MLLVTMMLTCMAQAQSVESGANQKYFERTSGFFIRPEFYGAILLEAGYQLNPTRDKLTVERDNAEGCDSVVTIHLTVNHSVTVYDTVEVASNELPYNYHGNNIPGEGDYAFAGQTSEGCDSLTYLHLTIKGVGIDNVASLSPVVSVYPNPTDKWVTVEGSDILSVEVIDAMGRKMIAQQADGTDKALIDLSSLPRGTYTLRVTTTDGVAIKRVVKGK